MHVHTFWSTDCNTSYQGLIDRASARSLDCLAITDHDRIEGALEFKERAPFPVIVGEEIKTSEGEIIGLFLREWIPPRLTPEETVTRIHDQGGIVYVPHPFDRVRRSPIRPEALDRIVEQVDVLEVINSRNHFRADNLRAEEYAHQHSILRGAGSDAHSLHELGHATVTLEPFGSAGEFLQSLKGATIEGGPSLPFVHLISSWHKFRKRRLPRLLGRSPNP
ncbi:MAG TPA: PHP-associated domain-containing protein [Chloroflexota bacterium]|nr:PHP-associated domain-containing protein [Chloroflexota bacterium]